MKHLLKIVRLIWIRERTSLTRGTLLAIAVLLAGIGLLGLSGWFITAAGMAGLAGIGIAFDVFRPSAGVRFLALSRTLARYGERILTHDATLRSLAALRVELLKAMTRLPFVRASAFRASVQVNRLTVDVDALDGVALRLVIPLLAAGVAFALTAIGLWYLVDPLAAAVMIAGLVPLTAVAFALLLAKSAKPARLAHLAQNAFRMRVMDLLRGRTELAVCGALRDQAAFAADADRRGREALENVDRLERNAGLAIAIAQTLTGAAVLALGVWLVATGATGPAFAALAFFVILAMAETVVPLRRGFSEYGKMADAARRVAPLLGEDAGPRDTAAGGPGMDAPASAPLEIAGVSFTHEGTARPTIRDFSLALKPGETVAMTGPSGSGKSTLLLLAAGVLAPAQGTISIGGIPLAQWNEGRLRSTVGLLLQRSALLSGTILEALALGAPGLGEDDAQAALEAVQLGETIRARGGLHSTLGESGRGLSGGESRRLALARLLVRKPDILLLDEPTEGLDRETARAVLAGIRKLLPDAAILIASHREAEQRAADRVIDLRA